MSNHREKNERAFWAESKNKTCKKGKCKCIVNRNSWQSWNKLKSIENAAHTSLMNRTWMKWNVTRFLNKIALNCVDKNFVSTLFFRFMFLIAFPASRKQQSSRWDRERERRKKDSRTFSARCSCSKSIFLNN